MKITIHTMSTKCQYSPTISTGNAGVLGEPVRERHADERQQHQDADGDVHAVEAGQHEERRAEQVRA